MGYNTLSNCLHPATRGAERRDAPVKMKDVIISIRGLQNYGDGDDAVEFVTDGQYGYADGCGTLTYMESELTGLEGTRTSLSFDPERMVIEREGTLNSRMIFEPGQRHMFLYETPFGAATMGLDTHRIRSRLGAHGGDIDIEYVVDMDQSVVGRNRFYIQVQEPKPSHSSDILWPN